MLLRYCRFLDIAIVSVFFCFLVGDTVVELYCFCIVFYCFLAAAAALLLLLILLLEFVFTIYTVFSVVAFAFDVFASAFDFIIFV